MANNGSSRVQTYEAVVNLNSNDKANCAYAVFLQQTAIAPPYHSFNMGIGQWFTDRLMSTVWFSLVLEPNTEHWTAPCHEELRTPGDPALQRGRRLWSRSINQAPNKPPAQLT